MKKVMESFSDYSGLLVEIVQMLKTFPTEYIALELMNEPPLPCNSAKWQGQQLRLLAAVRCAAPELCVILTGACGGLLDGLISLQPAATAVPALVYTFHFYEPYVFSHQGARWFSSEPVLRYLRNVPWPAASGHPDNMLAATRANITDDATLSMSEKEGLIETADRVLENYYRSGMDRTFIDRRFSIVAHWANMHGIDPSHILLGEFGATRFSPGPDRARYLQDVRTTAEENGFGWAIWNLFDAMGIMSEGPNAELDTDIVTALGLAAVGRGGKSSLLIGGSPKGKYP